MGGGLIDSWAALLLESAIKASVIIVLVGLATILLPRLSAARRHLMWSLVIGAVVLLPLLAIGLPPWQVTISADRLPAAVRGPISGDDATVRDLRPRENLEPSPTFLVEVMETPARHDPPPRASAVPGDEPDSLVPPAGSGSGDARPPPLAAWLVGIWLAAGVDDSGYWPVNDYLARRTPAYYTHVAWPMLEVWQEVKDDKDQDQGQQLNQRGGDEGADRFRVVAEQRQQVAGFALLVVRQGQYLQVFVNAGTKPGGHGFAGATDYYCSTDVVKHKADAAWWKVDLVEPTTVGRVVVVCFYGDKRVYGFAVETSLDGTRWTR